MKGFPTHADVPTSATRTSSTATTPAGQPATRTRLSGAPSTQTAGTGRVTLDDDLVTVKVRVRRGDLPALRSALQEIRDEIGGRLVGPHRFAREHALTRATIALGAVAAEVNRLAPKGDPDYAR